MKQPEYQRHLLRRESALFINKVEEVRGVEAPVFLAEPDQSCHHTPLPRVLHQSPAMTVDQLTGIGSANPLALLIDPHDFEALDAFRTDQQRGIGRGVIDLEVVAQVLLPAQLAHTVGAFEIEEASGVNPFA